MTNQGGIVMKKLLSAAIAVAFALTGVQAIAQSKDVNTKSGGAVADKKGQAVTTKDMKEKPKAAPAPKKEKAAEAPKPPKTPGAEVKTKSGGPVADKSGKDVTGKAK
jgi:hypothetical protein